jgi:hypothetical protein
MVRETRQRSSEGSRTLKAASTTVDLADVADQRDEQKQSSRGRESMSEKGEFKGKNCLKGLRNACKSGMWPVEKVPLRSGDR